MNRRRRYATQQRTAPIHLPPTTWNTYDIRLATQPSDSEHPSDEEATNQPASQLYWPIPEDHQPPPPADPSDDQIQAWITSQQPWSTFCHRLPIHQCLAYGHRPPPAITRQDPNRSYMMDISDDSIDPVYLRERIADFRSSGHLTWTSYLNTLSPRIRRAYLDQPPNPTDFKPTAISALHVPNYDNSGTPAPYYEPKDPAPPIPADQEPTRSGGYTTTNRHISDVTHQQRGRPILSASCTFSTDPHVHPAVHLNQPTTNNQSDVHDPPQQNQPPSLSDTVPPDTARLRSILTNLRKSQTSPNPNPPNTNRPGGYYTGHDSAHSSDSDKDTHHVPATRTSPPPEDISDAQIQAWISSQLPWSLYRQLLPTHQRLAHGNRPPPTIVRQAPNQQYLWAHHTDSIDSFRSAQRFHTSTSPTWSDYLTTLPARTRRAYHQEN